MILVQDRYYKYFVLLNLKLPILCVTLICFIVVCVGKNEEMPIVSYSKRFNVAC